MYKKVLFLLLILSTATAQIFSQKLCDGNLGANIFEDGDFGSGTANIISQDPGIAPGYNYNAATASPNDGSYVITNGTFNWGFWFGTWLRLSDNSSDPNGYFMLVNADFTPGLFYEKQVDGLCENTLYVFSADVINVVTRNTQNHILPNVSFLLDDVVQFNTGDVAQDEQWHEYGFTFTTAPGQTSIKLSLRNNAPGGNGNDLALDNISFRACGPDAFVSAEQTLFVCENDNMPTRITADIALPNQSLLWQISEDSINWMDISGETSPSIFHDIFDVGKYYYRYVTAGTEVELANPKCRIISDVLIVEVLPLDYSETVTICEGDAYSFGTQSLEKSGNYTESFVSSRGCDSIVDLELIVRPRENLDIDATLIDPSCNGFNDGSIQVNIRDGQFEPYTYSLGETSTSPLFETLAAGEYDITITDVFGCNSSFIYVLEDPPPFTLMLGRDTTINLGDGVDISIEINQVYKELTWNPTNTSPCDQCLNFSFVPTETRAYTATAKNLNDCVASDDIFISVELGDLDIYIPNTFSPTTNDIDSKFSIASKPLLLDAISEAYIYDRWGNLIHQISDEKNTEIWDGRINGKLAMPGVYTYMLELLLVDGNNYIFAGSVTLIH